MTEATIHTEVKTHDNESGTATAVWEDPRTKEVKVRVYFDAERFGEFSPQSLTPEIVYVTQDTIDEGGDYEALLCDKNYHVVENLG
tara:strand:+ start:96 stop:353 length:258 start_codon:yes stop_codon:yes gene_type:complete